METMNQDEVVLRIFQKTEYTNHFTVPPCGTSGGLSLSWKMDTQHGIVGDHAFHASEAEPETETLGIAMESRFR